MATAKITGVEASLAKLFSDDYAFTIPGYQRPYAWEVAEARQLLADLLEAVELDDQEPYFLGSVVLIKDDSPPAEVVDGQQRLTTLTLLLSVLRRHLPIEHAKAVEQNLVQAGNVILGQAPQPRLQLRKRDREFFHSRVQSREGIEALVTAQAPNPATDAQRNLIANARALDEDLRLLPEPVVVRLVSYLLTRTFLVVVTTPTLDSAHRIFSVLNDRGRPLTYTDILKAQFLNALPQHLHEKATDQWEAAEETLGRGPFEDLFTHYRMITVKAKAQKTNLAEFREGVLSVATDVGGLLDELLGPYTEAYHQLRDRSYAAPAGADAVNDVLRWLHRVDNDDWQPPALEALRRWGQTDTARLTDFLRRLERLAASSFIRRVDVTRRIRRYGEVLTGMADVDLASGLAPLDLTPFEVSGTLDALDGDVYLGARTRLFVLLRLDTALAGDGGVTYAPQQQTVEHVLPQNPAPDSIWWTWFTPQEHGAWVHRLANLVVLTRAKNSQAQNYDFEVKKEKYFSAKNGVAVYPSTSQVLGLSEWTPAVLATRQAEHLAVLADVWELRVP